MGNCAENTAKQCGINRTQQDDFAISSYKKSAEAWKQGVFAKEIVPVNIPQKKGFTIHTHKYFIYTSKYFKIKC